MPAILLINPNASQAATKAMVTIARRLEPDVTGWTAPSGPPLLLSAQALTAAAALVGAAEIPARIEGVLVSAFGDPGADALSGQLNIPVVGIGAAAARHAAEGGRRYAVVTHTPGLVAEIDALMRASAPQGAYLGTFLGEGDPTLLSRTPEALDAALRAAIDRAVRAGAEAVIIGGGPLGEAADRLSGTVNCALIAPIPAAMRQLLATIKDRAAQ